MTTRNEKKLLVLSNKRKRLIDRIVKAEREHKSSQALRGKLIEATAQQIAAEIRAERKRA